MFIININAARIKAARIFEEVPVALKTFPVELQKLSDVHKLKGIF